MKKTAPLLLLLILAVAATGFAFAGADQAADAAAAMAPPAPGDEHRRLAELAGQWDARIRMWMAPDAEPVEERGMVHNHMILGGRFLQADYKGSFMGQPFVGLGLDGYDPGRRVYTSEWRDSASLHVLRQEGRCDDADCTSRTYHGDWVDPATGTSHEAKMRVTRKSTQMVVVEMWDRTGDGEFWKNMEIIYTRR